MFSYFILLFVLKCVIFFLLHRQEIGGKKSFVSASTSIIPIRHIYPADLSLVQLLSLLPTVIQQKCHFHIKILHLSSQNIGFKTQPWKFFHPTPTSFRKNVLVFQNVGTYDIFFCYILREARLVLNFWTSLLQLTIYRTG